MTLELVKCPHCEFIYHTNIKEIVDDGDIVALKRMSFPDFNKIFRRNTAKSLFIDLTCPNCTKIFEWEVNT